MRSKQITWTTLMTTFAVYVSSPPVLVPPIRSINPAPHSLKCAGESHLLEKMRLSTSKRAEEDALRQRRHCGEGRSSRVCACVRESPKDNQNSLSLVFFLVLLSGH